MYRAWFLLFGLMILVFSGCGDSTQSDPNLSEETEQAENPFLKNTGNDGASAATNDKPLDLSRTSFEGVWKLILSFPQKQFLIDLDFALIELSKGEDGSFTGKFVGGGEKAPLISQTKVDGDEISFTISADGKMISCEGILKEGMIMGNFIAPGNMLMPLRIVATDETALAQDQRQRARPSGLTEQYLEALKSDAPQSLLLEFAKKHPESVYAIHGLNLIFNMVPMKDFEESFVKESADLYASISKRFGFRMESQAEQTIVFGILNHHGYPELASEKLVLFEKSVAGLDKLEPQRKAQLERIISDSKKIIEVDRALILLRSEKAAEAITALKGVLKEQPFNERVLFELAEYSQKSDQLDEAINYYGKLATYPLVESALMQQWGRKKEEHEAPSETFKKLWEKKHGSIVKMAAYQDDLFQAVEERYKLESVAPAAVEGTRRKVLCENFTGSPCPPCVGMHLALKSVNAAYDDEELITLYYHTQGSGPDPLANQHSITRQEMLKRFTQDGRLGTPMTTLNGKILPFKGGYLEQVEALREEFLKEFEPLRNQTSHITLDLSANAAEGHLTVSAKANGVVPPLDKLTMRLAVAEEVVNYVGQNGIREHSMVVRFMPGGPDGVAAKGGEFVFEKKMKLSSIKQDLYDYLAAFEQQANYVFAKKPLVMKKMQLVGYIQNEETGEVLQAEMVPVTGKLSYGVLDQLDVQPEIESEEKPEPKTDSEPKPTAEKPAPEKPSTEKPEAKETKPAAPAEKATAKTKEEPKTAPTESAKEEKPAVQSTEAPEKAEEPSAEKVEAK